LSTERPSIGFGMPLGAEADPQQQQPDRQPPSGAEVERFESLLAGDRPAPASSPGDAMLRQMGVVPGGQRRPPPSAARLLEELAGRLLVTDPSQGQGAEVRVALKDEVFPGLEIRIREEGGRLVVELASPSSTDLALLRADAPAFARKLGQKLGREVEIRLKLRLAEGEVDAVEPPPPR
jgi:hypothetical protein